MSKAGVESSIGDEYQSLIATFWAVQMLTIPEISSIEIDSTSLSAAGNPFFVDDIVIRYSNKSPTCCQCKKNQKTFSTWKIHDIKDDLKKAWKQWRDTPTSKIIFYSRNDFGELARLSNRARVMQDADAFLLEMPDSLQAAYAILVSLSEELDERGDGLYFANDFTTLNFLKSLSFETFPSETIKQTLDALLRQHVTTPLVALRLIMQEVDCIARRSKLSSSCINYDTTSRITREGLVQLLSENGHEFVPLKEETELVLYFESFSSKGRYWKRDIQGHRFVKTELNDILEQVYKKTDLVLIDGEPGAGKTCLLLSVLEELGKNNDIFPIFIQTREFDSQNFEATTLEFIQNIARMSEIKQVTLLVDSLDVLSISRDSHALGIFLSLLHRAQKLHNVTVIAACRTFDVKYDSRLSAVDWSHVVSIANLDFARDVLPFLNSIGVSSEAVEESQKGLLSIPRMLSMYVDIHQKGGGSKAITAQELAENYLHSVVLGDPYLGQEAYTKIREIAGFMIANRRLSITKFRANLPSALSQRLLSAGVLFETEEENYTFSHQTVVDMLVVANAEACGFSLHDFILKLKPVPFIRPSVRAFLFYIRAHSSSAFRQQVRATINSDHIAYHLKRLIVTTLAEITPQDADWPLCEHLFYEHKALFEFFFFSVDMAHWFSFFQKYFLPEFTLNKNEQWLLRYAERLTAWEAFPPESFISMWLGLLKRDCADKKSIARKIAFALDKFSSWDDCRLHELFSLLLEVPECGERDFLVKSVSRWVDATNGNDDILWQYIIRDVDKTTSDVGKHRLHCSGYDFFDEKFFVNRMLQSEELLSLAVDFIDDWSQSISQAGGHGYRGGHFLYDTSHRRKRFLGNMQHFDEKSELFLAVEEACLQHATMNSTWWKQRVYFLLNSKEGALQYLGIQGVAINPEPYIALIKPLLLKIKQTNGYPFEYELACLFGATAFHLDYETLESVQRIILELYNEKGDEKEETPFWVYTLRRNFLVELPAPLRLAESQSLIDHVNKLAGPASRTAPIEHSGGLVGSPVSSETLLGFSDEGIFRLLMYYSDSSLALQRSDWEAEGEHLIGGASEISRELWRAVSQDPERFLIWGNNYWQRVSPRFRGALLDGLADYIRHAFISEHRHDDWKPYSNPDADFLLASLLDMLERRDLQKITEDSLVRTLDACANIAKSEEDIERLCFMLVGLASSADPSLDRLDDDFRSVGINSIRGIAAEATIIMGIKWLKSGNSFLPDMLLALLRRFARDDHPAVRATILSHLAQLIHYTSELGWEIFGACVANGPNKIWEYVHSCLYNNYYKDFERIEKYLRQMVDQAMPEAAGNWGLISALALLSGKISKEELIAPLQRLDIEEAWKHAAKVFSRNIFDEAFYDTCLWGLETILTATSKSQKIFTTATNILWDRDGKYCFVPITYINLLLDYAKTIMDQYSVTLFHIPDWLIATAKKDCDHALAAAEMVIKKFADADMSIRSSDKFTKLLTLLFREAEEREVADEGIFLQRVITLQDALLAMGVHHIEDWLKDAERP